jgi:hypothetical protein
MVRAHGVALASMGTAGNIAISLRCVKYAQNGQRYMEILLLWAVVDIKVRKIRIKGRRRIIKRRRRRSAMPLIPGDLGVVQLCELLAFNGQEDTN